jgi:hypothetical protein
MDDGGPRSDCRGGYFNTQAYQAEEILLLRECLLTKFNLPTKNSSRPIVRGFTSRVLILRASAIGFGLMSSRPCDTSSFDPVTTDGGKARMIAEYA